LEIGVGKTYSYDDFDDSLESDDSFEPGAKAQNDNQKRKVKRKIEDYLEQKRLRKNIGDDDFDSYLED